MDAEIADRRQAEEHNFLRERDCMSLVVIEVVVVVSVGLVQGSGVLSLGLEIWASIGLRVLEQVRPLYEGCPGPTGIQGHFEGLVEIVVGLHPMKLKSGALPSYGTWVVDSNKACQVSGM